MTERRSSETYFLVLIGLGAVFFAFCTLFSAFLAFQNLAAVAGGDHSGEAWTSVLAGVGFATLCAALCVGAIRLYRLIERRGLVHPPRS